MNVTYSRNPSTKVEAVRIIRRGRRYIGLKVTGKDLLEVICDGELLFTSPSALQAIEEGDKLVTDLDGENYTHGLVVDDHVVQEARAEAALLSRTLAHQANNLVFTTIFGNARNLGKAREDLGVLV